MMISVKAARVNAEMSQKDVADLLGLSLTGYQRKESGKNRFYADELVVLSKLFNVEIENFFEARCRNKTLAI